MALSLDFRPKDNVVHSVFAPIVFALISGESDEDSFRYTLKIQNNSGQTLATLNQPPDDLDGGPTIFRIDAILRDYLQAETTSTNAPFGNQFGYTQERGRRFKVQANARYLDSAGVEQVQSISTTYAFSASLAKPALASGMIVASSGTDQDVNWNIFAPPVDDFYEFNATRWPDNVSSSSLYERRSKNYTNIDQGLGMWGGVQYQDKTKVIKFFEPECYRTISWFVGSNPNVGPPGGPDFTGGDIKAIRVAYYQEVGEEAFADVLLTGGNIFNTDTVTEFFVRDMGLGWLNQRDATSFFDDQTITSSAACTISFYSNANGLLANQVGATYYLVKDCETDARWGEGVTIHYLNRRCGMEALVFQKARSTRTQVNQRQTYARGEGNYVRGSATPSFNQQMGNRRRVLQGDYTRTITLTSRWVTEEESILYESLIVSPYIILIAEDKIHELICTTRNLTRGELRNDGLINYTISFELATRDVS